jgi:hypothetical protein
MSLGLNELELLEETRRKEGGDIIVSIAITWWRGFKNDSQLTRPTAKTVLRLRTKIPK